LTYQYQYAGTGIIRKRGRSNANAEFRVMGALGMRASWLWGGLEARSLLREEMI